MLKAWNKVEKHLGCYHKGICCFTGCGMTPEQHIAERDIQYAEEAACEGDGND